METARCKAFLSAVEQGTLSGAAEVLGYTPSGVSQLITALEEDLGMALLERTRKGVTLSEAGALMIPVIRGFVAQEGAVYEKAADIRGLAIGSVCVATYPSVATYWLPKVLRRFREEYPQIRMRLMEGIRQELLEWLKSGEADLVIMTEHTNIEEEMLDWIPLAEDPMVAVLPKEHPLAEAACYPIARCGEEDFVMPALGHDVDVEELLAEYGIHPHIVFTTMENPVLLSLIQNGLGMSVMNRLCTSMWRDKVAVLPLDPPSTVTFGIAAAGNRHLSPAADKFEEYLVRMLTKEASDQKR